MERLSLERDEHYQNGLQVWKEKSGELDTNKEILRRHLPPFIRKQLQTSRDLGQFNRYQKYKTCYSRDIRSAVYLQSEILFEISTKINQFIKIKLL